MPEISLREIWKQSSAFKVSTDAVARLRRVSHARERQGEREREREREREGERERERESGTIPIAFRPVSAAGRAAIGCVRPR